MSDLLQGFNPMNLLTQQQQSMDPVNVLSNILQNPTGMFSGFVQEPKNAFGEFQDAAKMKLLSEALMETEGQKEQQTQVEEKPEFPLPEEGKPKGDEPIDAKYKNEDGTTKSWEQIRDDSEVCKKFGGNAKDIKEIKAGAKEKFGDWENEPDKEKASRSYIKFRQLLEYADNSKSKNGKDRGKEQGNGNLNGLTHKGDIRDGSELSTVVNYFRHGKGFVEETTKGGQLKQHNDKFVREDGSTRSNIAQAVVDYGKFMSHIVPGFGNTVMGFADGLDKGGIKEGLKGAFQGAAFSASNGLALMDPTDPKGMAEGAKNLWGGGFEKTL